MIPTFLVLSLLAGCAHDNARAVLPAAGGSSAARWFGSRKGWYVESSTTTRRCTWAGS